MGAAVVVGTPGLLPGETIIVAGSKGLLQQEGTPNYALLVNIAPGVFLSVEDTGVNIRKAIREELDDLYLREVTFPAVISSKAPTLTHIVQDPATETLYALFWTNTDNKCYVGTIDENFIVSNVRLLMDNAFAPTAAYDSVNANWLCFFTYIPTHREAFRRYNNDFSVMIAEQNPMLSDGVAVSSGEQCTPINLFYENLEMALMGDIAYAADGIITGSSIIVTADYTANIPVWTRKGRMLEAPTYGTFNGEAGHGYSFDGIGSPMYMYDQLVGIQFCHHSGLAQSFPCYVLYDKEKDVFTMGISLKPLPIPTMPHVEHYSNMRCVTNLFKRELTAFVEILYGRPMVKVKNYAFRLNPQAFDPHKNGVIWHAWPNKTIGANEVSPVIPGYGRKSVYFDSSALGNLTVQVDPIGRNQWQDVVTINNITQGRHQTLWDALRLRLHFSAGATVSAYVVTYPYG